MDLFKLELPIFFYKEHRCIVFVIYRMLNRDHLLQHYMMTSDPLVLQMIYLVCVDSVALVIC